MGNNQSRQIFTSYNDTFNPEDFTQIEQCFVESLGEIHELTNSLNKHKVFMKIVQMDQELLPKDIISLHQKLNIYHPNLLKMYGYNFSHKPGKSGTQTEALIYFESPMKTLQDEIFTRRHNQQKFPALELVVYLKNCIDALALLEENGCGYECITSDHVFFSYDNQIKILNPILLGLIEVADFVQYDTNKENRKPLPLDIAKYTNLSEQSISKSVFSLGLTFLACALLEDEATLYKYYEDPSNERFFSYNMQLRNTYPPDFVNILRHMLELDQSKRPSFVRLRNNLVEYMRSQVQQDDQFPMSPTFAQCIEQNKKNISFSNSIPSFPPKAYKSSFSTSFAYNTVTSPSGGDTSKNKGVPDWSYKNNKKGFFDNLLCTVCTTNADEDTEIRGYAIKAQQDAEYHIPGLENAKQGFRMHTEELDQFSIKTTEHPQKTVQTIMISEQGENNNEDMHRARQILQSISNRNSHALDTEKRIVFGRSGSGMSFSQNLEDNREEQMQGDLLSRQSYNTKNFLPPLEDIVEKIVIQPEPRNTASDNLTMRTGQYTDNNNVSIKLAQDYLETQRKSINPAVGKVSRELDIPSYSIKSLPAIEDAVEKPSTQREPLNMVTESVSLRTITNNEVKLRQDYLESQRKSVNQKEKEFKDLGTPSANKGPSSGTKTGIDNHSPHSQKNVAHSLNKKKRSELVKQIISDYKKNGSSTSKSQSQSLRGGLNGSQSKSTNKPITEHQERSYHAKHKQLYDEIFGTQQEKNEGQRMSHIHIGKDSQASRYAEDREGEFSKPRDSLKANEYEKRDSYDNQRESVVHKNDVSSPYRGSHTSYYNTGVGLAKNEYQSSKEPYISGNKSFRYQVTAEQGNGMDKGEMQSIGSQRGSVSVSSPNLASGRKSNYTRIRLYSSPKNLKDRESYKAEEHNYRFSMTTPPPQQGAFNDYGTSPS